MFEKETLIEDRGLEFCYGLLGRLISDCKAHCAGVGHLWAGNIPDQLDYIEYLWENLPVKPEWTSRDEINKLEIALTGDYWKRGERK